MSHDPEPSTSSANIKANFINIKEQEPTKSSFASKFININILLICLYSVLGPKGMFLLLLQEFF